MPAESLLAFARMGANFDHMAKQMRREGSPKRLGAPSIRTVASKFGLAATGMMQSATPPAISSPLRPRRLRSAAGQRFREAEVQRPNGLLRRIFGIGICPGAHTSSTATQETRERYSFLKTKRTGSTCEESGGLTYKKGPTGITCFRFSR